MNLNRVGPGTDVPNQFNVIIEISMNSDPIKYEVDKNLGLIFVDRFISTAMHYPCNYGYIPKTLSQDGDPIDVLVLTPFALPAGVIINCRPLGMLDMDDESGGDIKIIALPIERILPTYSHIKKLEDLNAIVVQQIHHFFEHYKDLEQGKWTKIKQWSDISTAKKEIVKSIALYKKNVSLS